MLLEPTPFQELLPRVDIPANRVVSLNLATALLLRWRDHRNKFARTRQNHREEEEDEGRSKARD